MSNVRKVRMVRMVICTEKVAVPGLLDTILVKARKCGEKYSFLNAIRFVEV